MSVAPPPTHSSLIAKQPVAMFHPTSLVEVALPVTVSPVTVVVPKPVALTVSAELEAEVIASNMLPAEAPQTESLL